MFIDDSELVDRRVYQIRSRNLVIGAWSASESGFVGIREKLGSRYLFTEYARSHGGTARAETDLGFDIPEQIPLRERDNEALFDLLAEHEPRALNLQRTARENFLREAKAREYRLTPEERAERERIIRASIVKVRLHPQKDKL